MKRNVDISREANIDIDLEVLYLAEKDPDVALKFYDAIWDSLETIAQWPGAGSSRYAVSKRLAGVKMALVSGFESYLIFYRFTDTEVDILRVLHGSRDIQRVLRRSPNL